MSEASPEFISAYIEKLNTNISDLNRKILILETQFEYNSKAGQENFQELVTLKEESANRITDLEGLLATKANSLNEVNRQLEEVKTHLVSTETVVRDLKYEKDREVDRLTKLLDNRDQEIEQLKSMVKPGRPSKK